MSPAWHLQWRLPLVLIVAGSLTEGCDQPNDLATPRASSTSDGPVYGVEVNQPASLRGLESALRDHQGQPVHIACQTCHSMREADLPETAEALGAVHQGLRLAHGDLTCAACHDPAQADRLRLADGRSLPMAEAIRLCSQCHGPQARDWANGSHGGLRGHWDRRQGRAYRNHCIDCHDAHSPKFPSFLPAAPPRDRFLSSAGGHDG